MLISSYFKFICLGVVLYFGYTAGLYAAGPVILSREMLESLDYAAIFGAVIIFLPLFFMLQSFLLFEKKKEIYRKTMMFEQLILCLFYFILLPVYGAIVVGLAPICLIVTKSLYILLTLKLAR